MGRSPGSGGGGAQSLTGWIQLFVPLGYISLFLLLWRNLMEDGIHKYLNYFKKSKGIPFRERWRWHTSKGLVTAHNKQADQGSQ